MARRTRTARPAAVAKPAPARPGGDQAAVVTGIALTVAIGGLYVATAARDLVFGDSPELTGVAATFGVAHPPGYPIWTLIAHVFTLLPIGSVPFRVSVFSVTAGLAAAVVVYIAAWRLTRSVAAAIAAGVGLALTPVVWRWSVVPEVFPLNDLLAAALVALLLEWHRTKRGAFFVAAAFIGGLGMANQQTMVLVGPGVLALMWHHRREFRGGLLFARAAVAFGAGLLPYGLLLLENAGRPAWSWGDLSSLGDLTGHVLRSAYGTAALVSEAQFQGGSFVDRLLELARSFSVVEAALAALGLIVLYRRDRALFWLFGLATLFAGPVFIAYSNTNLSVNVLHAVLERFFLLPHVILAPVVAVGVVAGGRSVARAGARWQRAATIGATVAVVAATVGISIASFGTIDQRENRAARVFAEDILSAVRPGGILLAGGDAVVGPVGYLIRNEGARPDITYVELPLLRADWYVRQLKRKYPTLALTAVRYDGVIGTMRGLVESNGVDRFDIIGTVLDDSLAQSYGLYRRGLVEQIRPKQTVVDLDVLESENAAALRSYRIPPFEDVMTRPWERLILGDYGYIAYDVGHIFEFQKRYDKAREWYARAAAIDPDLDDPRAGLARLPRP